MFAPPHGPCSNPCRGAFRTDRAAGALAEFASARSHFQPVARLSGAKLLACSDARAKRSPHAPLGIVYVLFRGMWPKHVWIACFQRRRRGNARRGTGTAPYSRICRRCGKARRGTETPPCSRIGICRVFGVCHVFGVCGVFHVYGTTFRVRAALSAVPQSRRIWMAPAAELPRFPGTQRVPKRIHGDFLKIRKSPRRFSAGKLPVPDRPGSLQEPTPGSRTDGLYPCGALRGTHARHWPRCAASVPATRAMPRHHHFMPGEVSLP